MIDWFLVFNTTYSYITMTSLSGGRSQSTWREPPTMSKQLVNFITCDWVECTLFVIYKVMEEAGVPGENHRPWASNGVNFITCDCESSALFL